MQERNPSGANTGELDQLAINTIRTLSIDAVQQAKSGHPGTPMALAPLVYTIWNRVLRFDPKDPTRAHRPPFGSANGPRLRGAVVRLVPDGGPRGERGVRTSGQAVGYARRHPPLPPIEQQGAGTPRVPLGVRCRGDHRAAGAG